MAGSLIKIREIIKDLSPSEKKIADFIINNPQAISDLSIAELAEKSGSSEATIVRFCKLLDYNGYKDFKICITKDIAAMPKDCEKEKCTDIEPGDSLERIIENISISNKRSIDNTMGIIDVKELEKAIEAINSASRIEFYGVGFSYIVALDAMQKFSRIDKLVICNSDPHIQIASASSLKKGDVAIAISYSGETKDTYDSIKTAKESGATAVSITKYGQNSISELCDINLFVSAEETTIRSAAMSSRIAQLNVIDILFAGVSSRSFENCKEHLDKTRRAMEAKKIKCQPK